jgi:transcription factor IIIB 90 kDa subunit
LHALFVFIYLRIFIQRRKKDIPRDTSTPHGNTAAESVRNLIKKNPKYSKRINYEALKDLFVENNNALPAVSLDEKDADGLFTMPFDEKNEEEYFGLVIEEEGGGIGMVPPPALSCPGITDVVEDDADGDEDADADGEEESDKGDDVGLGWEDAYEQEV